MPWARLWHSNLGIRIRSLHLCLTVIFCCLFVRVNPRRGASGYCGLKFWTWSSYHHQRVAVNGHICSQVVVIVVMDLVQNTAMSAVLRSQVLEVQSILMDHTLCRRRFAVSAGVEVISIPIWNPMAFQSIVLEIQCPALPTPTVARFSPQGRAGNPNCHVSHFSSFSMEWETQCSSSTIHSPFRKSSLVSDIKIYPWRWSSLHCGFTADYLQCHSRENDLCSVSFNTDLFYVLF